AMAEVAQKYRIPQTFSDYREMLERVNPDIVYVIMGPNVVTPIALDCIHAGKHVFIEKPAGANSKEGEQLRDAAVRNGVYCMVGYQRRFADVTQEAMRLVKAHGQPTLAIGEFHKARKGVERNEMWIDVCHVVDL